MAIAVGGVRMLPPVGADQAEGIELAIVVHPGAVGVAKEMKASLPTRERQPGLFERPGEHSAQPPAGVKPEQLGVRATFEKWLTSVGLGAPSEAILEAATVD